MKVLQIRVKEERSYMSYSKELMQAVLKRLMQLRTIFKKQSIVNHFKNNNNGSSHFNLNLTHCKKKKRRHRNHQFTRVFSNLERTLVMEMSSHINSKRENSSISNDKSKQFGITSIKANIASPKMKKIIENLKHVRKEKHSIKG